MVFSSVTFLFLFLPVVLGLYLICAIPFLVRQKTIAKSLSNLLILLSSVLFYSWGEKLLLLVMLTSTVIDYCCGLVIARDPNKDWKSPLETLASGTPRSRTQKLALTFSVISNLSFLGFFKYANFFIGNYNAALASLGLDSLLLQDFIKIALPMGISFYTFQSMSYTIDVYRGQTRATRNFIDFACFVTMFPQLIAGPIIRYRDIALQLISRTVTLDAFSYGVRRFIVGFCKKVLVADVLARTADSIFSLPTDQLTTGLAWLGSICFTLQLYFDFSGYSDMAIGIGRMLGFKFPENFNYPYISKSISEYWSRWHITLGSWFRDYLYFPLGGNRVSQPRLYFNLITVFFLAGLWHGASWTFVIWGLFHGLFLILERLGLGRFMSRQWAVVGHSYFLLVNISSKVFFRAESFDQAKDFFSAMAGFAQGSGLEQNVGIYLDWEVSLVLLIAILGSTPLVPRINHFLDHWTAKCPSVWGSAMEATLASARLVTLVLIFSLATMRMATVTYTPFIYFRF